MFCMTVYSYVMWISPLNIKYHTVSWEKKRNYQADTFVF